MTKEELFAKVIPMAKADGASLREVLQIVHNHGIGEGIREAQELIAASHNALPPNGDERRKEGK